MIDYPNIYFYKNGNIRLLLWDNLSVYHRENDLPSLMEFHENGNLRNLSWYWFGEPNRDNDLPACISYTKEGLLYEKVWCKNGKNHRLYSPARIISDYYEYWYINGEDITNEVDKFIKEYDLPHYSKWTDNHKMLFKLRFGP